MQSFITFYLGLNSHSWLFCDSAIHYQSDFPFTSFSLSTKAKYLIQHKRFVYRLYVEVSGILERETASPVPNLSRQRGLKTPGTP
jgi:hypothetical protein